MFTLTTSFGLIVCFYLAFDSVFRRRKGSENKIQCSGFRSLDDIERMAALQKPQCRATLETQDTPQGKLDNLKTLHFFK